MILVIRSLTEKLFASAPHITPAFSPTSCWTTVNPRAAATASISRRTTPTISSTISPWTIPHRGDATIDLNVAIMDGLALSHVSAQNGDHEGGPAANNNKNAGRGKKPRMLDHTLLLGKLGVAVLTTMVIGAQGGVSKKKILSMETTRAVQPLVKTERPEVAKILTFLITLYCSKCSREAVLTTMKIERPEKR